MEIIEWFVVWFLFWGLFNAFFKWKIDQSGKKKYILTAVFFLSCYAVIYAIFYKYLLNSASPLLLGFLATLIIGFFFSDYFPFYKHIRNGKYYLASLPSNIVMQQALVIIAIKILSQLSGNKYLDVYFGIMFFIVHSPIVFFKWPRLKYLYLILTFLGGTMFSFLMRNYGDTGIFLSFLLHYCFYIPIFYRLRNERRI